MSTLFVLDMANPTNHIYSQRYDALKSILNSSDTDSEYIYNLGLLFECIFEYWEETGKEEGLGAELLILNEIGEIIADLRARINSNIELSYEFFTFTLFQSLWAFLIDLRIKVNDDPNNSNKDLLNQLINERMSELALNRSGH